MTSRTRPGTTKTGRTHIIPPLRYDISRAGGRPGAHLYMTARLCVPSRTGRAGPHARPCTIFCALAPGSSLSDTQTRMVGYCQTRAPIWSCTIGQRAGSGGTARGVRHYNIMVFEYLRNTSVKSVGFTCAGIGGIYLLYPTLLCIAPADRRELC